MRKQDKVAVVACSNGLSGEGRAQISLLMERLKEIGLQPVVRGSLYRKESVWGASAPERAKALMECYRDPEIRAIFDVSGGDLANEILPFLDFDVIGKSDKLFWGYSDLTTVLNAIYARTGRPSVLYQVRQLVSGCGELQTGRFRCAVLQGDRELFTLPCRFLRGDSLEGCVVGGNLRCLLKLAGTPYWPDMRDKVLLLESLGGTAAQMVTYLSQLEQLGVWEQVRGVILGTFTKMEELGCTPAMEELVLSRAFRHTGETFPIAKTKEVGHGDNSRAVMIGAWFQCRERLSGGEAEGLQTGVSGGMQVT